MIKIDLKVKYPRSKWERIMRNTQLKIKIDLYNKFPGDIEGVETIKPLTETEIKALRKKRRDSKYYRKNATKKKEQAEKRYWKRQIGSAKALNTPFKGCNGHHISDYYIVYIPKELHQKHPHSLKNYFRMDIINTAVLEWLMSEGKRDIAARMIELLPPELLKRDAQNFFSPYYRRSKFK